MTILPTGKQSGHPEIVGLPGFVIDAERVGSHLLGRDPTAGLFSALKFMDSVEDWVLPRLEKDDASREEVKTRLRRLSEIVYQYRQRIPPDNYAVLQVLAWLNTSVVIYVLDYLTEHQEDFLVQLLSYAKESIDVDINANLMMKRIRALYRARLLDRIYSPDNVDFVMRILLRDAQ